MVTMISLLFTINLYTLTDSLWFSSLKGYGPQVDILPKPRLTNKNIQTHKNLTMKEFTIKFSATIRKLKEGDWLLWS